MMSTDAYQAREIIKQEKANKTLINGCGKKPAKTVLIMDNGAVATSPSTMGRLCRMISEANQKRIIKRKASDAEHPNDKEIDTSLLVEIPEAYDASEEEGEADV